MMRSDILKLFKQGNRGMTFLELIVVIGIFSMVAGVVLFNFRGFSSSISLQNLSNQIALLIKQAQSDSISGKQSYLFSSPARPSYGVAFSAENNTALGINSKKFSYFADLDNDGQATLANCGSGPGNECLSEINIQSSDMVSNVCYLDTSWHCDPNADLYIIFKRPFPDASFYFSTFSGLPISRVAVEVKSNSDNYKHIIVWKNGQIELQTGQVPTSSLSL